MKTLFFNKFVLAFFGLAVLAVSGVGANAQDRSILAGSVAGISSFSWSDELKDEPPLEEMAFDIDIDIEEVATVTFINKMGEVVAVLKGDKAVLEEFYKDRVANSYFLSSYGVHEVYLIR
jgi:hypothetical protein